MKRKHGTCLMMWYISWHHGGDFVFEDKKKAVGMDWMATLQRLEDGQLYFEYRHRYYHPDSGHPNDYAANKDVKHWKFGLFEEGTSEGDVKAKLRYLFNVMPMIMPGVADADEVEVKDGDLGAALADKDWAHVQPVAAVGDA